jgi:hypothetical protein
MTVKWTNNATTTIASGIASGATSITVAGGTGALFPTLGTGDYFYATLNNANNDIEIVKVTARSGDVMTVTRGEEGTTAAAWVGGDKFELRPTAAGFTDAAAGENIVDLAVAKGGTGADNDLDARINLDAAQDPNSNGFIVRNGDHVSVARSITAGAGITVNDGDGQAANPEIVNDGVLALTAGDGIAITGTNANKTITNDGVTSFNGATGDINFTSDPPQLVVFASSGTWTKDTGLKAVMSEVVGAGGGGSTRGTVGKTTYGGAGGGGGGYSRKMILAASLGATETVTVGTGGTASKTGTTNTDGGTGGTSSFGSHCSATGGGGGQKYDGASPATLSSVGGSGGTGSNGDINVTGSPAASTVTAAATDGALPAAALGSGGFGARSTSTAIVNQSNGNLYGGGGGGGYQSGTNNAGTGADGVVLVWEFY